MFPLDEEVRVSLSAGQPDRPGRVLEAYCEVVERMFPPHRLAFGLAGAGVPKPLNDRGDFFRRGLFGSPLTVVANDDPSFPIVLNAALLGLPIPGEERTLSLDLVLPTSVAPDRLQELLAATGDVVRAMHGTVSSTVMRHLLVCEMDVGNFDASSAAKRAGYRGIGLGLRVPAEAVPTAYCPAYFGWMNYVSRDFAEYLELTSENVPPAFAVSTTPGAAKVIRLTREPLDLLTNPAHQTMLKDWVLRLGKGWRFVGAV